MNNSIDKDYQLGVISWLVAIEAAHRALIKNNPVLDSSEFLNELEPVPIEDIMLSVLGVPVDSTLYFDKDDENYFCRDYYFDAVRDICAREDLCFREKARSIICLIGEDFVE